MPHGDHYNIAGFFTLPPYETVADTAKRLAEGELLRWPGSISIHGHMRPLPKDRKRAHDRDGEGGQRRKQYLLVHDVEWNTYRREWV
jgi:hypothetical protein